MTQRKIKVVIAGGGTAGWVAAAALVRQVPELLDITLVESEEIGTVGVGEATIPPMRVFHKRLRIDEQEFMRASSATFKLGIQFEDWSKVGEHYLHYFGKTGKDTSLAEFIHFWLRGRELGVAGEFGEYSLECMAAREGKFGRKENLDINYAYHLEASGYAKFLRALCERDGVRRVEGKIVGVRQRAEDGHVEALLMESGDTVSGEFFIDCTGFQGLLIEKTLHSGYEDWSQWLICDRAVAVQSTQTGPPVPYVRSVAHAGGWSWQIPLQHRLGNGSVYCSGHMSDDEAASNLLDFVPGSTLSEPKLIKFRPGRRLKPWVKNVVALGLSSGFVEPLESTSIHLVMTGVTRLLRLFPFDGIYSAVTEEYNRQAREELERIRDFIILHYNATSRNDSDFWNYCRHMNVPETLSERVDLFRTSAHVFPKSGDLFPIGSWTQVLLGQNISPISRHRFSDVMSAEELNSFLSTLKRSLQNEIDSLPLHQTFVRAHCGV